MSNILWEALIIEAANAKHEQKTIPHIGGGVMTAQFLLCACQRKSRTPMVKVEVFKGPGHRT